jgi:hypothetical protein
VQRTLNSATFGINESNDVPPHEGYGQIVIPVPLQGHSVTATDYSWAESIYYTNVTLKTDPKTGAGSGSFNFNHFEVTNSGTKITNHKMATGGLIPVSISVSFVNPG